jgi:hypothetical protein
VLGDGFDCGDDCDGLGCFFLFAECGFALVEFTFALVEFVFAFIEFQVALHDFVFSPLADAFAAGAPGGWEIALGRDGAEFGVEDDLVDGRGGDAVGVVSFFGEVEAGDLEAVEEQAGAAGVEFAGGDALEYESDGCLDGGSVFGERKFECVGFGERVFTAAGGVVVIAEVFVAEADGGTAVSVGEDVAALLFGGVGHGSPLGIF